MTLVRFFHWIKKMGWVHNLFLIFIFILISILIHLVMCLLSNPVVKFWDLNLYSSGGAVWVSWLRWWNLFIARASSFLSTNPQMVFLSLLGLLRRISVPNLRWFSQSFYSPVLLSVYYFDFNPRWGYRYNHQSEHAGTNSKV